MKEDKEKGALVVRSLDHVRAAPSSEFFPDLGLPEIAFAGRSNVGKSSLLNTLMGRRKLARVSHTPGRTQLLHFYKLNDALAFVDVPGYGYAAVSKEQRASWKVLIESYLGGREELRGVILIVDIRRDPLAEELDMALWLESAGVAVRVVATKSDKIPKSQVATRLKEIAKQMRVTSLAPLAFSAETGVGKEQLWRSVLAWLPEETRARLK